MIAKVHGTLLMLRVLKPSQTSRKAKARQKKARTPITCNPSSTSFPPGVSARRRPVEDFTDNLADAMGFSGPLPAPSRLSYYDLPLGSNNDVQLAALLCQDELPTCARKRKPSVNKPHWSEADPVPGFQQVMDAPDLAELCQVEAFHDTSHSFLDMTGCSLFNVHCHILLLVSLETAGRLPMERTQSS